MAGFNKNLVTTRTSGTTTKWAPVTCVAFKGVAGGVVSDIARYVSGAISCSANGDFNTAAAVNKDVTADC